MRSDEKLQFLSLGNWEGTLIDVLVLVIVSVICSTMVYNFYIIVGEHGGCETGMELTSLAGRSFFVSVDF